MYKKNESQDFFGDLNDKNQLWMESLNLVSKSEILNFSSSYSNIFNYINNLKNNLDKYVIYGYGTFGKTIELLLDKQIVCYIDKNSNNINSDMVKSLSELKYIDFDRIIISTLGREHEIYDFLTSTMSIPEEKIISFHNCFKKNINTNEKSDSLYQTILPLATYSPWNKDEEFNKVYNLIQKNTLVDKYRCYELWTLVEESSKLLHGDVLEVGVWRGGTGSLIAKKLSIKDLNSKVYLCDTFSGVPKASKHDISYKGGEHADTDIECVKKLTNSLQLTNVEILTGIFPEDTGKYLENKIFRLCHIDVDVYLSAKDIVEWIWDRLVPGGIIVYDDYGFKSCTGITKHVEEQMLLTDRIVICNLNGHAIIIKK